MTPPDVTVLVTAAGGALAPLNIRLLKSSGRYKVKVIAVDVNAVTAGRHFADGFATVPPGDDPTYAEQLLNQIRVHGVDIVMPWSDEEAVALSASRAAFMAEGATIACSPSAVLDVITDKAATYAALDAAGIETARWHRVETIEQLHASAEALIADHGSFVVKPTRGRGNRGAIAVKASASEPVSFEGSREFHMGASTFFAGHADDLLASGPLVIMEELENPAYDVDVLTAAGQLLQVVARERINPAGVPFRGNIIRRDARLTDLAASVAQALNLECLHDCDLMVRRDGTPLLIEVNPRPSGSVASSILAGVPIYDELIASLRGDANSGRIEPEEATVLPHLDCSVKKTAAEPSR